jgi:uncharacterized protein DUF6544
MELRTVGLDDLRQQLDVDRIDAELSGFVARHVRGHMYGQTVDRCARLAQTERQAGGKAITHGSAKQRCRIRAPIAAERLRLVEEDGCRTDGYIAASATMRVRIAGLVPVINAAGETMAQAETVTVFNDMCVMAPHTLVAPAITWRTIGADAAEATFTNGGHTIRAVLEFNEAGALVNFRSDDRYQISPDGKTMKRVPWSTPLRHYRPFGSARLSSGGEARWHEADRDYAYIEFDLDDVQYNVSSR